MEQDRGRVQERPEEKQRMGLKEKMTKMKPIKTFFLGKQYLWWKGEKTQYMSSHQMLTVKHGLQKENFLTFLVCFQWGQVLASDTQLHSLLNHISSE